MIKSASATLMLAIQALPSFSYAHSPVQWRVGQEFEVDAGVYAKLLAEQSGWRLWKFDKKDSAVCIATKSSVAKGAIYPLGVGQHFFGGTPRLEVTIKDGDVTFINLQGKLRGLLNPEFRHNGDRFWTPWPPDKSILFGSRTIEVHITTWRYPEVMVGMIEEYGLIDFSGFEQILQKSIDCR